MPSSEIDVAAIERVHAASTGGGIGEALAGTMTGAYAGTQAGIAFGMAAYGQTPTPESMGISFASAFAGALASTSLSTGYQKIAQSNTGGAAMRAASGPIEAPDGVPGSCSLGDCFAENNQGGASSVASDAGGTGASGSGAATPYVPVDSGAEQAAVLAAEVLSGEALIAWAAKGLRLVKAAWAAKAVMGMNELKIALKTASQAHKSGSTRLGHALQKHTSQRGSGAFGKISGPPSTWHKQALKHLEDIVRGPGDFKRVVTEEGIPFIEKRLPDGRGLRLQMDHTFKGFVD